MNFCIAISVLKMEGTMQHFLHIMLFYFKKSKNTTKMQKMICAVSAEGVTTDWTCQKWFAKFCAGEFLLDGAPWSGRPVEVKSNQIKTLTEVDQCYTMWEITNILKMPTSIVTGENEKCIFHFTEKNIQTFWPTQYYIDISNKKHWVYKNLVSAKF